LKIGIGGKIRRLTQTHRDHWSRKPTGKRWPLHEPLRGLVLAAM
jgi:hypothetical protein